ncbi:gamma-glutamyltransferase family protein [Microlunatus antarcticus]|uniref:Gamma-glutamyltranspeptidase/glutathione hydrolase n=1 Tax=Microlunatus antarcticus TaxID=53388 RepID=A0A7W5P5M4_9ACTN|nr:gamma-glutamyltransferase [Microlunatus antarcticus]MBB3325609.1 gamma-glutamyltranspeptidase/glutathione hydrolase [Microlunatus antarcticus]
MPSTPVTSAFSSAPFSSAPPAPLTRPDLRGTFGMVASTHWLASATGQSVLERGGNAFDAAVAAAFVLHLVEPHLNGPGGDLSALISVAGDTAGPQVLVGQGPAPAGASVEHYRAEGLDLVPGAGGLAAAVPGAVDAWLLLLRDHGTFELADVWSYVLSYAEQGYPLVERVAATVASVRELFERHWPTSADFWLVDGQPRPTGTLMTNPAYAAVLRGLLDAGFAASGREGRIEAARTAWATGVVPRAASALLARPHRHSDGADHAGVITPADFAAHRATWEPAATAEFRGWTVAKNGPWGSGPVLLQALRILEGYPDDELDPQTVVGAHHLIEALKLALADRDAWYGDPDPAGDELAVPLDVLLSDAYAVERRALIGERASERPTPGAVPDRTPYQAPLREESPDPDAEGVGEPTVAKSGETRGDTCHVDVVDRWGNLVSATPSGGWLQSSPHVPELGFCLGTRLQMTWLDEDSPSALRPGRRPRTTLSPTLLLRDGVGVSALGTPGGDQQDQWQLAYLLRTLVGGWTPQQAIDAPTLHTTAMAGSFWPRLWVPRGVVAEDRLGTEVIEGLAARGHVVTTVPGWTLGRLSSVTRDPATGELGAAANPRGEQGYAVGR